MKTEYVRFTLALILVFSALGFTTQNVRAVPPIPFEGSFVVGPDPLVGVCPFDIMLTSAVNFMGMDYFDNEGNFEREIVHAVETDTFSANGVTLQSLPYTFSLRWEFDEAMNVIAHSGSGILVKVPLPDGGLFMSAGTTDFLAHPGQTYFLFPDHGLSGDVDAFCAAFE